VIELLKAAFVQGRLTKDELDARVARALASRTHAELAAVTGDIPAERVASMSRQAAPARQQRPENATIRKGARVLTTATVLVAGLWAVAVASGNVVLGAVLSSFTVAWLGLVILIAAVMVDASQRKRSGAQPPPRRTPYIGGPTCGRTAPAGGEPPPADPAHGATAEVAPSRPCRAYYPIGCCAEALLRFSLTIG